MLIKSFNRNGHGAGQGIA